MRTVTTLVVLLVFATGAQAARIVGTNGNDRLLGTSRADVVRGNQGRDVLLGRAGPDFLHGGGGRDRVEGGAGNDRIAASYDGANDTARCGPGLDTVNADLADAVAADCEVVGRRLARDPYTSLDGQHESQVEPDSLTVGSTTVAAFQVGRRFAGAADAIWFATSTDDGRSWRSGEVPGLTRGSGAAGPNERASDPVVAYDAVHGVWLISTLAVEGRTTRLPVSRSRDGLTWDAPVVAAEAAVTDDIAFDKNWIICDNGVNSPFRGRCYLLYTDAVGDEQLGVVRSDDGGLTWSTPVSIPVSPAVGAFPVVQPSGGLVVAYLWGGRGIGASTSTDGGTSFGPPVRVAEIRVQHFDELRFFPLPAADADPSGRVWIAWHECRFDAGCETNSIVVSSSADGRTWSAAQRVTSGRNAFVPAIGFHPTSGRAALVYHVVRAGGEGVDVELVELRPEQNGRLVAAGAPRRLSAQTMSSTWMPDTLTGRMLADYVSVHYAGSRPLAVWVLASEPAGDQLRQAVYATRG